MNNGNRKVAIVTGASRGIGAAIASRLAADGMAVVVNYVGSAEEAETVISTIRAAGGVATAVRADVADPAAARRLFEEAEAAFGKVSVLVNNAGIMQPGLVPLADTSDALFDRLVAVNLKGTFNTLREAASRLGEGGRIVNFSSSTVGLTPPGYSAYVATKAGVEAMTNIFAKELRGRSITVNAVAPGPTATALFFNGKSQELIDHFTKAAPLERLGTPEDIAAAVAFLVGPDGAWINGQTLRANGGIV
ncbi:SDR family oxidoreductase [Pendulispora albinea]|uniref:SDR family oxidoreductase n=1 Tax=Pendulispora albinea TaxID=2741071 RepID=A0ABZ2M1D5_9BACT